MARVPASMVTSKRDLSTTASGTVHRAKPALKRSTRHTVKSRHVFFAPVDFISSNESTINFPTSVSNHNTSNTVAKKAHTAAPGSGSNRRRGGHGGFKKHPMSLRCPSAPYHRTSVIMDMHDTPNRSLDLDISDESDLDEDTSHLYCPADSNCYGTLLPELSEAGYDELFRCDSWTFFKLAPGRCNIVAKLALRPHRSIHPGPPPMLLSSKIGNATAADFLARYSYVIFKKKCYCSCSKLCAYIYCLEVKVHSRCCSWEYAEEGGRLPLSRVFFCCLKKDATEVYTKKYLPL